VTLSAAKSPHRRVAGTRPRVFAPKGRRNVATGGVPACRDGTRGHFVRMHSRPGWGGGSSIAAHALQWWSIPRPPTGPAVSWGLAPTGSARACRPSLHPWQQSSAPFGAAESVTDQTAVPSRRGMDAGTTSKVEKWGTPALPTRSGVDKRSGSSDCAVSIIICR